MQKFDAIVVLGMALNHNNSLNHFAISRLDMTLRLYRKYGCPIIVSGGGTASISESKVMKLYLVNLNVPEDKILEEDDSIDTIGNAYFTKQKYLDSKNWFSVVVVTSQFHMERSKIIFKTILGQKYSLKFCAAPDNNIIATEKLEELYASEKKRQQDNQDLLRQLKTHKNRGYTK